MNELEETIELLRLAKERFAKARKLLGGNDPEELDLLELGIGVIMGRMAALAPYDVMDGK